MKLFKVQQIDDENYADFQHEFQLMCSLKHPNIVSLYGACVNIPRIGVVMEYCEYGSLKHVISKGKLKDWSQKLRILLDVAKGMQFLHNKSIIHRDLKSDNVLIDSHWVAKLTDFGISRMKLEASEMTRFVGTGAYMVCCCEK